MMEEIKTKLCTKCKKVFPATLEYFRKDNRNKSGLGSWCKKCNNIINSEYQKNNREICTERNKRHRIKNPDKIRVYVKKYRNSQKGILMMGGYHKKHIEELSNSYIAGSMRKSVKDLTPDVIETQRLIIKIKRELKQNN